MDCGVTDHAATRQFGSARWRYGQPENPVPRGLPAECHACAQRHGCACDTERDPVMADDDRDLEEPAVPSPTLTAFLRQVRQFPKELQKQECGLIAIGRRHAEDFDAGHAPSGSALQRVLDQLRKLAAQSATRDGRAGGTSGNELEAIRAKRAHRQAGGTGGTAG